MKLRWIDDVATTTCVTRVAPSPHFGRHYPLALPAPPVPGAAPRSHPSTASPADLPAAPLDAASLYPTSAREPIDLDAARFIGAEIRLFDAEVLVVQVAPRVIGDRREAPALVAAFSARFKRTIVLVAQDRRGVPTFFGPAPIAIVLAKIPFDALAWKRYRYRPPRPIMLPIPIDPLPQYSSDAPAYDSAAGPTRDLGRRTRTLPPGNGQRTG